MPPFANVQLNQGNIDTGPVGGRVYSIDHLTDTMIVKTYPTGTLVATIPLDTGLQNEVLEIAYDQFYWWTLSRLGATGTLGIVINKWKLNAAGTLLEKQLGVGNEIPLLNTAGIIYNSEAFLIHHYITRTNFFIPVGATSATLNDASNLQVGDNVYFGPSTAGLGERVERKVTGKTGNQIFWSGPLTNQFNVNDQVTYRRNLWIFNNYNGTDPNGGSLIQINSYNGNIESVYSSCEWKHVTAASSFNGNFYFARNQQLLQYKPFGANAGYQTSAILNNTEIDNNTLIKVHDMWVDSTNIYKLQTKQHQFNTSSFQWEDIISTGNHYDVDQELLANRVFSLTAKRNSSVLFGRLATETLTVKVRDQYDLPVLGRSVSVIEDDASGSISPGFNSFVTNAQGEGTTIYSTGSNPTFRQPTLNAIDVLSSFRTYTKFDQVPSGIGTGFLDQRGRPGGTAFVTQVRVTNSGLVEQSNLHSVNIPVEQSAPKNLLIPLEQTRRFDDGLIEQKPLLVNSDYLEQTALVSGVTTLAQYQFLIFALPVPYSIKNPVDTNILVRIVGFGAQPLDTSTLIFEINGVNVASQVVITPFGGGIQIDYNPPINFNYSEKVTVFISIQDTAGPPRTVSTFYTFDTVGDFKKPFLDSVFPPDNSINNLPLTEVYAIIRDLESGLDLNSIEVYIEGKQVTPVISEPNPGFIKVFFQTPEPFINEADISVAIFASDNEQNQIVGTWTFKIRPSDGVRFTNLEPQDCDVLVPVDANVCAEVFGLEDGVNLDSINFNVNGQEVTYVLKPKVYRRE